MKYVYTAIFSPEPESTMVNVSFPDLPGCNTFGDDLEDAISMAKDALCLWLYNKEEDGAAIPPASKPKTIKTQDEDFITAIPVDTEMYRRYFNNKAVKKTLTIPAWLNERAEDAHINFSGVLQAALKEQLHIDQ